MYRILKNDEVLATVSNLTYVKKQENGSYALSDESAAQGIVLDGTVYHVAGKPEIEGVETVTVSEISEIAYQREQAAALDAATLPASIAFVTLSEAGQIDDATMTENATQFAEWVEGVGYGKGAVRRDPDDGNLYRCVQEHTSQADWKPHAAASLWSKIGDPTVEYPEWSQPIGAHDAYKIGDKVSYNGKHYVSEVDNNVWSPDVYGWAEVKEE